MEKGVLAAKVKNLFPSAPDAVATIPLPPPSLAPLVPLEPPPAPSDPPVKPGEPEPPAAVQTNWAPVVSPALLGAIDQEAPREALPREKGLRPPPAPARKRLAVAHKGAVIMSQDGVTVQYRKKCSQCGCEDRCRSSMPIGNGTTRAQFYCPKCRKSREVLIQGIMQ